jgi:hypothetical protein
VQQPHSNSKQQRQQHTSAAVADVSPVHHVQFVCLRICVYLHEILGCRAQNASQCDGQSTRWIPASDLPPHLVSGVRGGVVGAPAAAAASQSCAWSASQGSSSARSPSGRLMLLPTYLHTPHNVIGIGDFTAVAATSQGSKAAKSPSGRLPCCCQQTCTCDKVYQASRALRQLQ